MAKTETGVRVVCDHCDEENFLALKEVVFEGKVIHQKLECDFCDELLEINADQIKGDLATAGFEAGDHVEEIEEEEEPTEEELAGQRIPE